MPERTGLICVAAPSFVVSAEHGQLSGAGTEGFYDGGRRALAVCTVRIAGQEPVSVQGRMAGAREARFVAALPPSGETGPDPVVSVERLRSAEGKECITVRNAAARTLRLPVELRLGTDLAELRAVAGGMPGAQLPASVHGSGLAWTSGGLRATVTAEPAPDVSWAAGGMLRWDWELKPGTARTLVLDIGTAPAGTGGTGRPGARTAARRRSGRTSRPSLPWLQARAEGDDARVGGLFRSSLDDLGALLLRDAGRPEGVHLAAGVPWRCTFAPADSLRAARMLLPLGTRLAMGTLYTLSRGQTGGEGPGAGRLPGPLRRAGPQGRPSCTGVEATLLFPAVLAEAYRWGMPRQDLAKLLPVAERCLQWLRRTAGDDGYVHDPAPGGAFRCEVQAYAHRAAVLGADLLDAEGRGGGGELREWAAGLRERFRTDFWHDDRSGGRPLALRADDGQTSPLLASSAAELLDTGLAAAGRSAEGLLDTAQTGQLARLLAGPAMDSGWGLRTLGSGEPGHNLFGHRSGAVRVQDTATAVVGLLAAGFEKEAGSLLRGVLDAAAAFGLRLPEMYAAEQRTDGSMPLPHPVACRPAAVSAAGAVQLLLAVSGLRPDVPAGTVAIRPAASAPLGAVQFMGLLVAGAPFSVRVNRLGAGMVEEAADGLHLLG